MNKSTILKQAHAMTKQIIKLGDNYSATFSACLKLVYANVKQAIKAHAIKLVTVTAYYESKGFILVLSEVTKSGVSLYNVYNKLTGSLHDYCVNINKVIIK